MKYCIDFYGTEIDLLNQIDEINIDLSKIRSIENELEDFCELHKHQRINLCINDYEEAINKKYFTYIFDFQKKYPEYNVIIRLPGPSDWSDRVKEDYPDAKFYFYNRIVNWDTLLYYLEYGVTDVFIAEEMGFELENIIKITKKYNTKIRVYPNVAQAAQKETSGYLKFWIRPEDIDFYEKYIDVCEFYYNKYEQQQIYYDIYKKDKKWSGDLNEIIFGLNTNIDNTRIVPRFCQKRVRCGRQCMKDGKCQICKRVLELSELLQQTPIRVIIEEGEEK